jgi:hypothetical protein
VVSIPSFDAEFPTAILPVAFTPDNFRGRRPKREEYPYDPAVSCLVLIPGRLFVVKSTVVPGVQGMPFAVSVQNTRVWRKAALHGDAFRVDMFRDGILSVDAAPYKKAVQEFRRKMSAGFDDAALILESDTPDLVAYDALTVSLTGIITEPYRSRADEVSRRVGYIAAKFREGGREQRAIANTIRAAAHSLLCELRAL